MLKMFEGLDTRKGWMGKVGSILLISILMASLSVGVVSAPPASFIVTYPNGGENWGPGSTHTILWSSSRYSISRVKIELMKAGVVVLVIANRVRDTGSYKWTVPLTQTPGSDYRIRITREPGGGIRDSSDGDFIIGPGPYKLTLQTYGGIATEWSVVPGELPQQEHPLPSYVAGTLVTLISFQYGPLPEWEFDHYELDGVKVGDKSSPLIVTMDSDHTVKAVYLLNTITVRSPNGGEKWLPGSTHIIRWTHVGTLRDDVTIELWKGGVRDSVIAEDTPDVGYYRWTIPSTQQLGTDYKIKIFRTLGSSIGMIDSSDSNFAITAHGTITLILINQYYSGPSVSQFSIKDSGVTIWSGSTDSQGKTVIPNDGRFVVGKTYYVYFADSMPIGSFTVNRNGNAYATFTFSY